MSKDNLQGKKINRRRFLEASVVASGTSAVGLTRSVSAQETTGGDGIWKFKTGDFVVSSPTVVDGTVYFGSNDETVYAVDAETGEEEWAFTGPSDMVRSSPNVVNGTVYVGCDDGNIYAINQSSGEQQWVVEADINNLSSPTVTNGLAYVAGSDYIYALDQETGNEIWSFGPLETGYSFYTSVAVIDSVVYAGTSAMNLTSSKEYGTAARIYAIDAETGEEVWVSEIADDDIRTTPTILNGTLYVGADDSVLYAINTENGDINWSFETDGQPSVSPTVFDETVYVGTSEEYEENEWRGILHAIDTTSGEERWGYSTSNSNLVTNIGSSPTVAGGTVFFGAFGVIAVDAVTGDEQWQFGPSNARSSPTVVDGTVFVGIDDGALYALDAGVDASSQDSRVLQGALGHHHEWAGESSQNLDPEVSLPAENDEDGSDGSNPVATVFQQFSGAGGPQLLWALAGLGTVSGAYAGYKKLSTNQESTGRTQSGDSDDQSVDPRHDSGMTMIEYDEIKLGEIIRETSDYKIQQGEISTDPFWVLTPPVDDSETVDAAVFETFSEKLDPWSKMGSYPHLLSIFGAGTEPVPWAAIEESDATALVDQTDTLSVAETAEVLTQVCDALHHVHRYGIKYVNLTTESVLYTDQNTVKLRGILDVFDDPDPWYNAPEEFDGKSTEQTSVYRIGVIAYELFTGVLPYADYPDGNPKAVITNGELTLQSQQFDDLPGGVERTLRNSLANAPTDRYETVLHLRDQFRRVSNEL